jgi:UDP-N-acetylmuramoyl-L-alanyl-D-glutamate--2,6-diaminopimelate ligase
VSAKNISLSMNGMTFTIVHQGEETAIESQLTGRFNVSNILAAFGTGIALGINKKMIQTAIRETHAVRGRFEQITSSGGWTAVIDYAHTPDALEKTLKALKDVFDSSKNGKIITVFGCGGNRDRSKRSQMGLIASSLSDVTVITSDNPRFETPESIIDEVMQGIKKGSTVFRDSDRKEAINKALGLARKGDVILVAGKGHEDYQVIEDRKIHFSDRETIEEYLRAHP